MGRMANFVRPFKNWVAEGVASEFNESTVESVYSTQQFLPKVPLIITQSKV